MKGASWILKTEFFFKSCCVSNLILISAILKRWTYIQYNNFFDMLTAIQCEIDSEYSPCISPCPVPTCNNLDIIDSLLDQCEQLPCIEGKLLTFPLC